MQTPTLLGPMVLALSILSCCGNASAQLTISEPVPTPNTVRQVSATGTEGILAARRLASSGSQIRVTVQYLMVDDATRAEIYEILDPKAIRSSVQTSEISDSPSLHGDQARLGSSQRTRCPSWVTACVLDDTEVAEIIQKAVDSELSDLSRAPSVSLLDGKEAEMSDIVQRPFVINFEHVGGATKPVMEVLDEGILLRLLGKLVEPSSSPAPPGVPIDLTAEITVSRILDVKADQIYGLQKEPLTVHVPIHQVTTAVAAHQLVAGQTLLLDPHVTKNKSVTKSSGVPMIGRIPYVGRRFRNIGVANVEQKMLVLLKPSIEKKKNR
jgi:hypothetical protein